MVGDLGCLLVFLSVCSGDCWGVGIRCLLALCSVGWVFAVGFWVEPVCLGANIIDLHLGANLAQDK